MTFWNCMPSEYLWKPFLTTIYDYPIILGNTAPESYSIDYVT